MVCRSKKLQNFKILVIILSCQKQPKSTTGHPPLQGVSLPTQCIATVTRMREEKKQEHSQRCKGGDDDDDSHAANGEKEVVTGRNKHSKKLGRWGENKVNGRGWDHSGKKK